LAFSSWKYKKYKEDVMSDELIADALELLKKRYDKMANWLQENDPVDKCPECSSTEIKYVHDGAICKECDHKINEKVPYPVKGGVVASRKMESVIKEVFASRMEEQRRTEEPPEDALASMPFEIEGFDTGEYTEEQVRYLNKRYKTLLQENNIQNEVDKFYVRSLVVRELKLMMLERRDAVKGDVDSMDIKRQYKIYNDLSDKLKANRSSRSDTEEESFFSDMEDMLEEEDMEDILAQYNKEEEARKEYREKAKKRKEEVGNPY
jgi:hypothetical protein